MYYTIPSLVFQAYFELNGKTIFQKILIIKKKYETNEKYFNCIQSIKQCR